MLPLGDLFIAFVHCSVSAIAEVKFDGGVAKTTSFHSDGWAPKNAFIIGHANGYHDGSPYGMFPILVWYEFPAGKTFVPARVSFHPRPAHLDRSPTMWEFVGSNDPVCGKDAHWTVLCQDRSDSGYRNNFTIKDCQVDEQITAKFRCLGISILRTHNKDGNASFKNVRMWKRVELASQMECGNKKNVWRPIEN